MNQNLTRTTTYIEKDVLMTAKRQALEEGKSVYEIVNAWLKEGMMRQKIDYETHIVSQKTKRKLEEAVKLRPLHLKGTFNRREIYEWL